MKTQKRTLIRRSVALPLDVVEDALAVAPEEVKGNMNALVLAALRDFIRRRQEQAFEAAMAEMAADPEIRRECAEIAQAFQGTERDGLTDD